MFLTIHFFIRNSFLRNLYWDSQTAKKLSVLKPQRLRNSQFFHSFSYYNFEDTLTNFDKDLFRKNLSVVQTVIAKGIPNLKVSLFVFNYLTVFSFCVFYFKKNVKKLLRNFEYSKSQRAKKLSVLRLDVSHSRPSIVRSTVGRSPCVTSKITVNLLLSQDISF